VDPRVLRALSLPVVGYNDPFLFEVLDDVRELLRYVFKTRNEHTFPVSGTGSAGMETAVYNIVEPGDEVVVGLNGFFGSRIAEMVLRAGGKVIEVKEEWGRPVMREAVEDALKNSTAKAVAVVHVETSTGVLQPLRDIAKVAKEYGALLLVDAVTSLGGCELPVDELGIDACYSCTQKCLSCPPGMSPVTFSDKAFDVIMNRKSKVRSWYLDVGLIEKYWSKNRLYHHTPPVSMIYALREGLRIIHEEGIENRWARHRRNGEALIRGLEAIGLETFVEERFRLSPLTTVVVPARVSEAGVRQRLLDDFGIEIGGGLGELKGKIWRIGLMGANSNEKTVIFALHALERTLAKEGFRVKTGEGVKAALDFYSSS